MMALEMANMRGLMKNGEDGDGEGDDDDEDVDKMGGDDSEATCNYDDNVDHEC